MNHKSGNTVIVKKTLYRSSTTTYFNQLFAFKWLYTSSNNIDEQLPTKHIYTVEDLDNLVELYLDGMFNKYRKVNEAYFPIGSSASSNSSVTIVPPGTINDNSSEANNSNNNNISNIYALRWFQTKFLEKLDKPYNDIYEFYNIQIKNQSVIKFAHAHGNCEKNERNENNIISCYTYHYYQCHMEEFASKKINEGENVFTMK